MRGKRFVKLLAVFLSMALLVSTTGAFAKTTTTTTTEDEETTSYEDAVAEAQEDLETQKAEIEANLAEVEEKLAELLEDSELTEEYVDLLDQKIGYINEQLTILDEEILELEEDIDALEVTIEENTAEAEGLEEEITEVEEHLAYLNEQFEAKYEAYCLRMRAIYISGNYNLLTAILTCSDISSLLTRYEMIKAVSKSDAELLADIEEQTNIILSREDELNEKKEELDALNDELSEETLELVEKQETLISNQEIYAEKKATLAEDKAESDALLAELTAESGMYTEYRNEDSEIVEAVEEEISALIAGLIDPEDATTATTSDRSDDAVVTYNYDNVYSKSDGVLNMTYPVPGYYTVSAGYPNYSSGSYHGGIDFPCPTGTAVVAAQSGVVIKVERLTYSYGYYVMIYHGTDSKGRSVVTLYAHNSSILVSVGESVSKGETIAKSGSTGNSTGPHLHFEVRIDGTRVNPTNYLSK